MPDEASLFQTTGMPWSERAALKGLEAVLAPGADPRRNLFLHGVHLYAATTALNHFLPGDSIIDFGCGTGRFSKFFASRQHRVLATEITAAMIERAKAECGKKSVDFLLTNGIEIPVRAGCIDGIWCCAVLRYSLFVENPAYQAIATEMYRVLRPGGYVVNCEMYVDAEPRMFTKDFEAAGFKTRDVRVLHRYRGRSERLSCRRFWPRSFASTIGTVSAFLHSQFDDPQRGLAGLRDYLFVWQKPAQSSKQSPA